MIKQSSMKSVFSLCVLSMLAACGDSRPEAPQVGFEELLQTQLIQAQPGDVIDIPAGVHNITRSLSLTVPGVTIRGQGMDDSILSFKNQVQGAEGLLVTLSVDLAGYGPGTWGLAAHVYDFQATVQGRGCQWNL